MKQEIKGEKQSIGEKLRAKINKQEWIIRMFAIIGCVFVLYIALPIIGEWTYYQLKNIYEKGTIITRASVRIVEPSEDVRENDAHNEPTASTTDNQSKELGAEEYIKEVFGQESEIALAIAKCESGFNPDTVGDKHLTYEQDGRIYGASYGLFQLRDLPGRFENPNDMLDYRKNVDWAKNMFDRSGWFPWTCFTNKHYLNYL